MRYYQIILTLMCLLFVSWKAEAGWTGCRELGIVLFWQGHSGPLVNHQDGNMIDPENCGRKDWYILPVTHPHYQSIYSLLLAAKMANKKVNFHLKGCLEGLPVIEHVQLE
jgi:hypothetical protein